MQPGPQHLSADEWSRRIRALRALARELVAGEQEREDLVQGALAAALERPPRELSWSWLAQVLRRRAMDLGRQRTRRGTSVEFDEHTPARGARGGDAAEIVARLELHEDLTRELLALREPYRTTLARRYFDELSIEQIAKLEGVPLKTVRIRLERGRALLRERLRRKHGHDLAGLAPLLLERTLHKSAAGGALAALTGSTLMVNKLALGALAVLAVLAVLWLSRSGEPGHPTPLQSGAAERATPEVDDADRPQQLASARNATDPTQSPPQPAVASAAFELDVKVLWSDGAPAEGVGIFVRRDDHEFAVPRHALAAARADANGAARFDDLRQGDVLVEVDRGQWERVRIEPGVRREVVLQLERGVDVFGVVRDAAGSALAGADIWLTSRYHPYDWSGMGRIATSGPDGRFQARGLHASQSLGATLSGRAPSELVDLDLVDKERTPVEIELVLNADGVDLRGVVLDAAGAALAGAWVCAGDRSQRAEVRPDRTYAEPWLPRSVRSDEQGRFELLGLPAAPLRLEVQAREHARWCETLDLSDGRAREHNVQLQAGAALTGIVTDETGAPLAHAFVHAFAAPLALDFLGMGQYDDPSCFGSSFTLSDARGAYRLEHVPTGVAFAYATAPRRTDAALRPLARAQAELATFAGLATEWNPRVERGPTIRGQVLYADRKPMAMTFLSARPSDSDGSAARVVLHTDENGRFEFFNLERRAYEIEVQVWTTAADAKPLRAHGVWPDGADLELVASVGAGSDHGAGVVTARVADPHGRAQKALGVMLRADNAARYADRRGDVYEFTGLPAGRYQVQALNDQTQVAVGEWFELGVDEQREAPLLTIPAAARLHVQFERGPKLRDTELDAFIQLMQGGDRMRITADEADRASLELSDGVYVVEVRCVGAAQVRSEITVSGDTSVVLTLIEGVWQPLEIALSDGVELNRAQLRVVDSAGQVWVDQTLYLAQAPSPLQTGVTLAPGRYTLSIGAPGLAAVEAHVALESLEASVAPVKIVLR